MLFLIIGVVCVLIRSFSLSMSSPSTFFRKQVLYNKESGKVLDCLFCNIIAGKEPSTTVYSDSKFVVFRTIKPASSCHLLVVPRQHIRNIDSLSTIEDAELIKEMQKIGESSLRQFTSKEDGDQYCFHVPPYNSVDHLHLHCIGNTIQMDAWNRVKYWQVQEHISLYLFSVSTLILHDDCNNTTLLLSL